MTKEKFTVTGMSCSACSAGVERVTKKLNGVKTAEVSLLGESLTVEYDETLVTREDIFAAVTALGYGIGEYREGFEKAVYRFDDSACAADVSGDGRNDFAARAAREGELYSAIYSGGRNDGCELPVFQERIFRARKASAEYGYACVARLGRFVFVFDISCDKDERARGRACRAFVF